MTDRRKIGCANSAALTAGIAGFSVRAGAIPSSLSNHFALYVLPGMGTLLSYTLG